MEARLFVMKYEAAKNRKSNCRNLEIDRIQNSKVDKDTVRVETLKDELQKLEDVREEENARRYFAKNNLEGEHPTKFFCSLSKKLKSKAQFEAVNIKKTDANGEEVIREVTKQSEVEWEVRKFYWKLYRKESSIRDKGEILERIGDVKQISEHDRENLDKRISMEEVNITLKNARNNVAPGAGGFTGAFYKVFWKFLKQIVLGAPYMKYLKTKSCL